MATLFLFYTTLVYFNTSSSSHIIFKRKKEKKESRRISGGFKRSQVFLKKYYPTYNRKRIEKRKLVYKREPEMNAGRRVEIFSKTRRA